MSMLHANMAHEDSHASDASSRAFVEKVETDDAPSTKHQAPAGGLIAPIILALAITALWAMPAGSQPTGCDTGSAFADLDVNKVRARLYNTGGLFWKGQGPLYNVPRDTRGNAIFAHSLWIGGMVDGQLRVASADYGNWEFWPGPIDEQGNPPVDCSPYDRLYSVKRSDIEAYENGLPPTADLLDWPSHFGAPVIDGDGNPDNYNLRGGDRPAIIGDQTVWWVMNDAGNQHSYPSALPLSIEVQVTAFAFLGRDDALSHTTFYRYDLVNRTSRSMDDVYVTAYTDVDLGDAGDDYTGCDTTLGLVFAYNGDGFDGGGDGYGEYPPAVGSIFLEAPRTEMQFTEPVRLRDGIPTTSCGDALKGGNGVGVDPGDPVSTYRWMTAQWTNGDHWTYGGFGRGRSEIPTRVIYPGEPGEYWSEENIDGEGSHNTPSDRRFSATTGPFTIPPGETRRVTYAIVFAQGTDRLDSVRELKSDARKIQAYFDSGFSVPDAPDPPRVSLTALDESLILTWDNGPGSNNRADGYEVADPLLASSDIDDRTYTFEGYNVFRFESSTDSVGKRIATFDRPNGVRRVFDVVSFDVQTGTSIVAEVADGTDGGVRHAMRVDELTNYRSYYFGVQAYAYSEHSDPHILKSPIVKVSGRPSSPTARRGGTVVADSVFGSSLTVENGGVTRQAVGNGSLTAEIVDPLAVTGHTYRLEFIESQTRRPDVSSDPPSTYRLIDEATDEVKFDGVQVEASLGHPPPQQENVLLVDGLSISIETPRPGALDIDGSESWAFVQVRGGDGITPDACDEGASSRFGCSQVGGNWVYASFNGSGDWVMYHQGAGPEESLVAFVPNDFEVRATANGSYGYFLFSSGKAIWAPLEIWDIGPTGPFGVNDPTDDVRLIPALFSDGGGECLFGFGEGDDPFGLGWQITDRVYAYYPAPERTYADWEAVVKPLVDSHPAGCPESPAIDLAAALIDQSKRPLQRLVWMMDATSPYYRPEFIPEGNVIRFLTTKPNLPGDRFWINTAGYSPKTNDQETAKAALDLIGIVPNPYKGISDYELSAIRDAVRFTNLPDVATIRIYNLAGTLITQLEKTPATTGLEWDLTNDKGHHTSSGMYLVHVDVPGVGERVIKFGLVKKRR